MTFEEAKRICAKYLRNQPVYKSIQKCTSLETILKCLRNELSQFYNRTDKIKINHSLLGPNYTEILRKVMMILMSSRTILFSGRCQYKKGIIRLCSNTAINYRELRKSSDVWVRDYLFEACKNSKPSLYIRNKIPEFQCNCDKNEKTIIFDMLPPIKTNIGRNLTGINFKNKKYIHETLRPLEGGNLFIVYNKRKEKCVLLGKQVLSYEKYIYFLKARNYTDNYSIERYKKIFGTDKVIIIPNLSYHLDLQMAYIGCSTFLINSLDKIRDHFRDYYNTYAGIKAFHNEYESKVNKIINILKENQLDAEKVAGSLYVKRTDIQEGIWGRLSKRIESTFISGFDIYSNWKDCFYFVTSDSHIEKHKNYFKGVLSKVMKNKIKVIFMTRDNMSPEETQKYISSMNGGLRCQTNFIDTSALKIQ